MNTVVKSALVAFIILLCLSSSAHGQDEQGLESPFVIWLMNNESRAISRLAADRHIMAQFSQPCGLFPFSARTQTSAAAKLWEIHLQFFRMLPETNHLYRLIRRFGSGKLVVALKEAKPAHWLLQPIPGFAGEYAHQIRPVLHQDFVESVINALQLNPETDKDLEAYRQKIVRSISDQHRRLLGSYFETFLALYPSDNRSRYLWGFLHQELKKNVTQGVSQLFTAGDLQVAEADSSGPDEEALQLINELAQLDQVQPASQSKVVSDTDTSSSSSLTAAEPASQSASTPTEFSTASPTEPVTGADLFNIWD